MHLRAQFLAVISALVSVFLGIQVGILNVDCYDLLLSLPVMGTFRGGAIGSTDDLLIRAAHDTPFLVYRIVAWLESFRLEEIVEEAYFLFHLVAFYLFWLLSKQLVKSDALATLSVVVLSFSSPAALSFNGTFFPTRCFISSTVAIPLVILSFLFFMRRSYGTALGACFLAGLFHPGYGLIATACFSAAVLSCNDGRIDRRQFYYLAAAGVSQIAVLFIAGELQTPIEMDEEVRREVWSVFTVYSRHTFFESHWPDYYFEYVTANVMIFCCLRYLPVWEQRYVKTLLITSFILCGLYALNLYLFKNISVAQSFLFRASLVTKLCGLPILLNGALQLVGSVKKYERYVLGAGIAFFLIAIANEIHALFFFAIALVISVWAAERSRWVTFPVVAISLFVGLYFDLDERGALWCLPLGIVLIGAQIFLYLNRSRDSLPSAQKNGSLVYLASVVLGVYACLLVSNWRYSQTLRITSLASAHSNALMQLYSWCRSATEKDAVFVLDPLDNRYGAFRYLTERSVFLSWIDINELFYQVPTYVEAITRLEGLGMKPDQWGSPSRVPLLVSSFDSVDANRLATLKFKYKIDYVIKSASAEAMQLKEVFRNKDFVVYGL